MGRVASATLERGHGLAVMEYATVGSTLSVWGYPVVLSLQRVTGCAQNAPMLKPSEQHTCI